MSCGCHSSPCTCSTCDPANEPLASSLNNFITAFFGSVTRTCVNNQIVWSLPCELDSGISGFPRLPGEGIACYFLRFMQASGIVSGTGLKGYETTDLSNVSDTLIAHTDVQDQDYTGTLSAPVSIILSTLGSVAGDHFYISLTGLVVDAINSLSIQSDATILFTFNTPGTLDGYMKVVYTGTAWKITLESVTVS